MFGADLVVGLTFVGIVWSLVLAYRSSLSHQRFMKVTQLKADMNARLIDRMGTDPRIAEFLGSDAQHQFLDHRIADGMLSEIPAAQSRVLTSIQASAMLLSAGAGCLVFSRRIAGPEEAVLQFFGTMGIALGIGAFLSGAAALVAARIWRTAKHENS